MLLTKLLAVDGGNVPFSVTRTPAVGEAVASILKQPDKTANRVLFIHEAVITKNQLIDLAECLSRKKYHILSDFDARLVDGEAAEAAAWKAYHSTSANPMDWIIPFINLSIWAKDEPCHFRHTDNDLLGVPLLEGVELASVLECEIEYASSVLRGQECIEAGENDKAGSAFEAGKLKLVGY